MLHKTKEFAILFSQGYSKLDIFKIIALENIVLFCSYFSIAYFLSTFFRELFLSKTRFYYLFTSLLTLRTFVALLLLVTLIVSISVFWGILGLKNKNIIYLLKEQ